MSTLIPACDIDRAVLDYEERCADARRLFAEIDRYETKYGLSARVCSYDRTLESEMREAAVAAWNRLMSQSGLLTFMSAEARENWRRQLHDGKTVPEVTRENIAATFEALYGRREEFFLDGVERVFRRLSWDYRANSPRGFGPKIVIRNLVDRFGFFEQSTCDALDDLRRVLDMTAGRHEQDHRQGYYSILTGARYELTRRFRAFDDGQPVREQRHQDEVLDVRWFRNGNAHVKFVEPGAPDRLNRIMARRAKNMLSDEGRSGRKW